MAKKKKRLVQNDKQLTAQGLPAGRQGSRLTASIPDRVIVVCFYAIVAALPLFFIYPTFDIFELAKLTLLRLLTLTLIGAWSVKCYQERRVSIARTPLDLFIVIYLIVYILATVFSKSPLESLFGEYGRFEGLLTIINYTAVFCLAGSLIRNNSAAPDTRMFVRSLILTAVGAADAVSVYGVLQRFGIDFFTWSGAGTDLTRAFSTMGNPIYIAAYLTIVVSIALALFLSEPAFRTRLYLGSSIIVMTLTLVFTFSRAGWAGFLFSLIILISLSIIVNHKYSSSEPRRTSRGESRSPGNKKNSLTPRGSHLMPLLIPVTVAVFIVVLAVALSSSYGSAPTKSTISRALSAFDLKSAGAVERISLWKSSVEMIKDKPVLGWGPDTFGTYFTRYRRQDLVDFEYNVAKLATPRYQNRPHSDILQQGVSAGVLGIISYLLLLVSYFYFALRHLMAHASPAGGQGPRLTASEKYLLIGIIAGLAGYFFQIQFSFSTIAVTPQVWLLIGITFLVGSRGQRADSREQKTGNNIVRVSGSSEPALSLSKGRELDLNGFPKPLLATISGVVIVICLTLSVFSVRLLIADYYFDQGIYALETADVNLAEESFNRALAFNPYEAEYAAYAANSFTEIAKNAGDAAEAEPYLSKAIDYEEKAVALNPDMPGYRYNLGNALYYSALLPGLDKAESKRRYEDALDEFLLAVAWDPKNADAHLNLASTYLRLGRKADAISEIRQALAINPGLSQAKTWLNTLENKNND